MTHSYFFASSVCLDYPIYIAFNGFMSIDAVREHEIVGTVVRHLTGIDFMNFSINKCSCKEFKNALIKIDFTK